MAQERPITPEKQLLKLIEDPKTKHLSPQGIKQKGLNLFSISAIKSRISYFREQQKLWFAAKRAPLDIRAINNLLRLGIVILVAYLGVSLTMSVMDLNKKIDLGIDVSSAGAFEASSQESTLQKISVYVDKARARDIFKFGSIFTEKAEEKTEYAASAPDAPVTSAIDEATKSLTLVGIAWSEDPDAMIEDSSLQKIHFVKRGDLIGGKVTVQAILRDRVILSCEGLEKELR